MRSGGIFDLAGKLERLAEVNGLLEDPRVWERQDEAQSLGRERQALSVIAEGFDALDRGLGEARELYELAGELQDEGGMADVVTQLNALEQRLQELELSRMFSQPHDSLNCFLDIQSGSGGTEAQDWAQMVMRMYLKFGERHGFRCTVVDLTDGDVAGIKGCTLKFEGHNAFGYLRTETGIHRLVRKSPFDSNNRRHTSFCSAFAYPEIDDEIEISINPADLQVDVFRSSGAGGQHVNKTESAVRITHRPTGIVVSCQNERSQFANRDHAMKQLRAKLYEYELRKKQSAQQAIEDSKADIGWGSQIRSYVLDDARIKDLRTGIENRDVQKVLNGDLDEFIEASLKSGL